MMTLARSIAPLDHSIPPVHNAANAIKHSFNETTGLMTRLRWPRKEAIMKAGAASYREMHHGEPMAQNSPEPQPRAFPGLLRLDFAVARRRVGMQRGQQSPRGVGD